MVNVIGTDVLSVGQDRPSIAVIVVGVSPPVTAGGLTFEQQKELLLLQLEHNKMKYSAEVEKQLAVEKLHSQTECSW